MYVPWVVPAVRCSRTGAPEWSSGPRRQRLRRSEPNRVATSTTPLRAKVSEPSRRVGHSACSTASGTPTSLATNESIQESSDIQTKLDRTLAEGGYVVCSVESTRLAAAERELCRPSATCVDIDAEMLDALHAIANKRDITWDAIMAADAAGPTGPRWGNLDRVAKLAYERIESKVLGGSPVAVLTRCGLLERFGGLDMLDGLRHSTTRSPKPGQTLRTLWVIVPGDDLTAAPTILDKVIPTTLGGSERLALTPAWFGRRSRSETFETPPR